MSDPPPDGGELERGRELAVAFLLGELDEAGLRQLHALLTGPQAEAVAAVAWQQLDTAVDLRAQLGGPAFAEAVRLRLAEDGTFARRARGRLGLPGALPPVDCEPPRPPRSRRRLLWFAVPMLLAMVATWLALAAEPPARVTAVAGDPVAAGRGLAPGDPLAPGATLALPAGAAVAVRWRDGSAAVVAGPAQAVVQPGGLALTGGGAWLVAGAALAIGTPDREAIRLGAGGRLAIAVDEGLSVLATPAGAVSAAGLPKPGGMLAPGGAGRWPGPAAVEGVTALPGGWWRLDGELAEGVEARLEVALEPGPVLTFAGDSVRIGAGDAAGRSLPLAAAAGPRRIALRLRGRLLLVAVDGVAVGAPLPLAAVPQALRVARQGPAAPPPVLSAGPEPRPPLVLDGW